MIPMLPNPIIVEQFIMSLDSSVLAVTSFAFGGLFTYLFLIFFCRGKK